MKRNFPSALRTVMACVLAVFAACCFTACSGDDDPVTPAPQTFKGRLSSTVPSIPTFEPVVEDNTAVVTWGNPEQTIATVTLGAFKISAETPMGPMAYEIGEMTITDVACVVSGDKITLSQPEFQCMAGTFDTKGAFEGTIVDGQLQFVMTYKPGSMPFMVQSVFEGK